MLKLDSPVDSEFKVLVVEDMSDDFEMLQRSLRRTRLFDLTWERTASGGLSELGLHQYDAVLLDLTLPDSRGLDSVVAFTGLGTTPVVVLSGIDDENTALESVQAGAHDYVVKGKFDTLLISRTLRYAIERYKLTEELRLTQQQVRNERELRRLKSDTSSQSVLAVSASEEQASLQATHTDFFANSVAKYSELIDKALELRDFKIEYNVPATLRALAHTLGTKAASPRDVVEVHTTSLNLKVGNMSARRSSLCNEEARYLLTGLLGHLCLFYKNQSTSSTSNADKNANLVDLSNRARPVSEDG